MNYLHEKPLQYNGNFENLPDIQPFRVPVPGFNKKIQAHFCGDSKKILLDTVLMQILENMTKAKGLSTFTVMIDNRKRNYKTIYRTLAVG
jgi:hypothetical protein